MKIIFLIIAIPILIFVIGLFSYFSGSAFRKWNEGENYDTRNMDTKGSLVKTMTIGVIIVVIVGWIFTSIG